MSRGNDPIGEALGFGIRVTFWLLKLAWKLTFGLVGAAIGLGMKSAESDPVAQIRSQQAGSVFGEQITALKCAKCGTDNEFGEQICYYCGELLSGTRLSASAAASQPTNIGQLVAVLAVLGVLILCVVVGFSGVLLSSTRPSQNYQPTASYKYVYVNRGATATVQAEATLAAGGVLPTSTPTRTSTPRPPTKTPTDTAIPSATYTPGTPRPTATPVPRPTPLHQGIAQRVGDLGELINFEDKLDVVSQPFQGGMMLLRNEQLVYVLYNDGRWQPFGSDIFGSLADWRLLSWEQGAQMQHSSARQFVGVWLHLGAANSELGLALKPTTPPAFPKTDEMVDYKNGIIFMNERLGSYILYNSGQWVEVDKVSANNPHSTEQSTAVPNSAVTPSNQVQSSPPTDCKYSANPEIFNLWGGQLGCPIDQQQVIGFGAEQAMQGGHLFWRKDTDGIYVIYDRNKQTGEDLMTGDWFPSDDKWNEVDSCIVNKAAPPGTPPMIRGFSWLWCQHLGGPDGDLGWPLDKEYARENVLVAQPFENGLIWKGSDAKVYALFYNGKFLAHRF